ncbi:MFS transporter [Ammonicoccus fulvus]|uniref:MFS transporter n=1 Tax=Ammonicoccus fulvus TaxID=3138240 RepID=A0ABZ3FQC9_9ACTN
MNDKHRVASAMFGIGWGANHFAGLLLIYRGEGGLSTSTVTAMFGAYALGLVPALFAAGALSDRVGRRRVLILAGWLSLIASIVLASGVLTAAMLFLGRFLAGAATGGAMVAGTAWVRRLAEEAGERSGARTAAVALSGGFGGGALVAAALAQWLPWPRLLAYALHVALMLVVIAMTQRVVEPREPAEGDHGRVRLAPLFTRPFLLGVGIWAPWVFGTATVSFVVLPTLPAVAASAHGAPVFLNGAVAGLTLLTGVLVQPFAQRLNHLSGRWGTAVGLLLASAGLGAAAWLTHQQQGFAWWALLPVAIVLGSAYGMLLVAGLIQVERLSSRRQHATYVAAYYSLTYVGFGYPFALTLLSQVAPLWCWLALGAGIAALTIPARMSAGDGLRR